eukprot:9244277-Ditylum_brightwellii.AAC.1
MKYAIMIDCAVGATGHGKDVVDGLNAVDKRFLRTAVLRNSIPEEHNNVKKRAVTLQHQWDHS